jgi:hypothetical protein
MEDDLKKFKVEHLSNHWLDLIQRRPLWKTTPMEDDLKKLKVEYLSNNWLDLIQILNLS